MSFTRTLLLASLLVVGCSSPSVSPIDGGLMRDGGIDAGSIADAGLDHDGGLADGGDDCDPTEYPCGSYGYEVGDLIENMKVFGLRDQNGNGSLEDESAQDIKLQDYFADKTIKAIVIVAHAEWCSPCNAQMPSLAELYKGYQKETGTPVALLNVVFENSSHRPSDFATITGWSSKYSVPFDVAFDPSMALSRYYDSGRLPMGMVVRASDMKITLLENEVSTEQLKTAVDEVLNALK